MTSLTQQELLLVSYSLDKSIKEIESYFGDSRLNDEHLIVLDSLRSLQTKLFPEP